MSPVRSADSVYRSTRRVVNTVQGIRRSIGMSHRDDNLIFKRIAGYLDRNGRIRREEGPAIARRIAEIRGMPAGLTPEKIEALLEQGALIGKFLPGDPYSKILGKVSVGMRDLAIKASVKPADITPEFVDKALRSSNLSRMLEDLSKGEAYKAQSKLLNDLAAATDVRSVLEVNVDSIINMDICSGARVYVRDVATGRIKQEVSKGIVRKSIYADDFLMPRGEKRQYIFRLGEARRLLESAKNAMAKTAFIALFKSLVIWYIPNREEWPEYGMNRQIVEKLRKALKHESDRFLSKFKGLDALGQALIKELFEKGFQSLCLVDSMIVEDGRKVFEEFITRMNASKEQRAHLEAVLGSAITDIRGVAARFREDITKAPRDLKESSARANNQVYSEAMKIANEWAARNHMPVLLSTDNFPFVLCNYIEALKEFEEEVKELKCHPDCIRDRLILGLIGKEIGREYRVLAIVLANNDAVNIALSKNKERKDWSPRPIFESEERTEEVVGFLSDINDAVAKALVHEKNVHQIAITSAELEREKATLQVTNARLEAAGKASNLDANRQKKLRELTEGLLRTDEQSPIEDGLARVIEQIYQIMRTNGENFTTSITRTVPDDPGLMEIVANTKRDENGKLVIGRTPKRVISDWVVTTSRDVFIFDKKVYIDGIELGAEALQQMKMQNPIFYGEIDRILNKGGTFGCAAIRLKDQVWVLNLTDAKLDMKTMDIFRETANILSGGLRIRIQTDELQQEKERFEKLAKEYEVVARDAQSRADENRRLFMEMEIQAITDELTKTFRRVVLDKKLAEFIETAKRVKGDFTVAILDIDYFKSINDTYGHSNGGDPVLVKVPEITKSELGEEDIVVRTGGEEFVILLKHRKKGDANVLLERIRKKIADTHIKTADGKNELNVTVSIGYASWAEDATPGNPNQGDELQNKADFALSGAKLIAGIGNEAPRNQNWGYSDRVRQEVEKVHAEKKTLLQSLNSNGQQMLQLNQAIFEANERGDAAEVARLAKEQKKMIDEDNRLKGSGRL